jgi:hypothetical protein
MTGSQRRRSVVTGWCVVLGLAGVLPSAGTRDVALFARQVPELLDNAAVERALLAGASGMPPLELTDRGGLFSGAGSGYRVVLYTPLSWIARLAETAAAEGEALSAAEIGNEDRALVLRVFASPSAPTFGSSKTQSSSVLKVTLLDERRRTKLQPLETSPFTARHRALLGSGALAGLEATFRLSDLEALRGAAGEEFFVRVDGTGYTKDFKIKRKHFDRLPL